MLTFPNLILFLGMASAGYFWWRSQGLAEIALQAGRVYCQFHEMQFLDETVSLIRIGLKRDRQGKVRVCWLYEFEFTESGDQRNKARIMLLGDKVLDIVLE